jgi:hypothetical protein
MKKRLLGIAAAASAFFLTDATDAFANLVFPAIANQFAVAFVLGSLWAALIALAILIVETLFIKKLLSCGFLSAFGDSFFVNLASSFLGIFIFGIFLGSGKGIFAYGNMRLGTYLGLVPGYVLTVLIEGLLLMACAMLLRRRLKVPDFFKVSALMNLCSYLILLASIMAADILTNGQNFNIR